MTELAAPGLRTTSPVLVTGGAGFIGSNLADRLAEQGHDVLVFDALARAGVAENLDWLKQRHPRRVSAVIADVRDAGAVAEAAQRAQAVFHLAAQVAVTTSLVDPRQDFEVNLGGTINVLDALRRRAAPPPIVFASTNKVYGDLADVRLVLDGEGYAPEDRDLRARGIGEDRPLDFHTPYGCSKGAADQYVLDACRSFGVPSAVLRMSCIYGPRQFGTTDQGWLAHFLLSARDRLPITIYGDGRQMRDVLYVDDAVAAYLAAWRRIAEVRGRAFNLGGGVANAVTLRQVIAEIELLAGRRMAVGYAGWRQGDQRYFVADASRAAAALGLHRPLHWREGLARLARFYGVRRAPAMAAAGGGNA